jgi:hypothetical protein
MSPKTPAFPYDVMHVKIASSPLSDQDVRTLLRSETWNVLESRNDQLVFLEEFSRTEYVRPLDSGHLGDVFGLTRDRIRKVLIKAQKSSKEPHYPLSLTHEQEIIFCALIRDGCRKGNYVTPREFFNFTKAKFQKILTYE